MVISVNYESVTMEIKSFHSESKECKIVKVSQIYKIKGHNLQKRMYETIENMQKTLKRLSYATISQRSIVRPQILYYRQKIDEFQDQFYKCKNKLIINKPIDNYS